MNSSPGPFAKDVPGAVNSAKTAIMTLSDVPMPYFIQKKYDKPITPYQRLIDSNSLSDYQLNSLINKKKTLNPFILKKGLEEKLNIFFKQLSMYNKSKEFMV